MPTINTISTGTGLQDVAAAASIYERAGVESLRPAFPRESEDG